MDDLNLIFTSIPEIEDSFEVRAVATYYPEKVTVFVPRVPYLKRRAGLEPSGKLALDPRLIDQTKKPEQQADYGSSPEKYQSEDNISRSVRRSKKKVRDYILCNRFEYFATFTFKSERQDADRCRDKMHYWIKNQQRRSGKFQYLVVPEKHNDGALHFHATIKDYKGKLKPSINPYTNRQIVQNGRKVFEFPSYRSGFTNVKKIEDGTMDNERVASYVTKYITKDMPLFAGKNRYWASQGLVVPPQIYNPPSWYLEETPFHVSHTEYGTTLSFRREQSSGAASDALLVLEEGEYGE